MRHPGGPQVLLVTAVEGDGNQLAVTRGANGTAPAAHLSGAAGRVLTDYSVNPVPTCTLVRPRLPRRPMAVSLDAIMPSYAGSAHGRVLPVPRPGPSACGGPEACMRRTEGGRWPARTRGVRAR
jgi:hypothetical protein